MLCCVRAILHAASWWQGARPLLTGPPSCLTLRDRRGFELHPSSFKPVPRSIYPSHIFLPGGCAGRSFSPMRTPSSAQASFLVTTEKTKVQFDQPSERKVTRKDRMQQRTKGKGGIRKQLAKKCTVCDAVFTTGEGLRKHVEERHTIGQRPCMWCGKLFMLAVDLDSHVPRCEPPREESGSKYFQLAKRDRGSVEAVFSARHQGAPLLRVGTEAKRRSPSKSASSPSASTASPPDRKDQQETDGSKGKGKAVAATTSTPPNIGVSNVDTTPSIYGTIPLTTSFPGDTHPTLLYFAPVPTLSSPAPQPPPPVSPQYFELQFYQPPPQSPEQTPPPPPPPPPQEEGWAFPVAPYSQLQARPQLTPQPPTLPSQNDYAHEGFMSLVDAGSIIDQEASGVQSEGTFEPLPDDVMALFQNPPLFTVGYPLIQDMDEHTTWQPSYEYPTQSTETTTTQVRFGLPPPDEEPRLTTQPP